MNKIQFKTGYRHLMMEMLMSYGLVPYRSLKYLDAPQDCLSRALRQLVREEYVRVEMVGEKTDLKKCAVLNQFENKAEDYVKSFDRGYYGYARFISSKNKEHAFNGQRENTRRRAFRLAETSIIMQAAGIGSLFSQKPKWILNEKIEDDKPYFYNATEMKNWNFSLVSKTIEDSSDIKSASLAMGVLVSQGGQYVVYHGGSKNFRWVSTQELTNQQKYRTTLLNKMNNTMKVSTMESTIVLFNTIRPMLKVLSGEHAELGVFSVNNGPKEIYALLIKDTDCVTMLHNMTVKDWQRRLIDKYVTSKEYTTDLAKVVRYPIECHGYNDHEVVFCFCIPDLVKFYFFLSGAKANNGRNDRRFKVICYEHQLEFIKRATNGYCEIEVVELESLDDFERKK